MGEQAIAPHWRPAARRRAGSARPGQAYRRRARLRLAVSVAVLATLTLTVLIVPPIVDLDQQSVDLRQALLPPSFAHPFGTDEVGRDVLLRCVYGLRVSFIVGLVAAAVSTVIGVAVGAVAGAFGGWVDRILMRGVDAVASVPHLLLGIFIVAMFQPGLVPVIASIGLTHWLGTARIVRSEILSLRERPFVDAAVVGGASRWYVIRRHLLPNVAGHAALAATLVVPHAIWHETALSFLGLGLPVHLASLGNMLNDGQQSLLTGGWWNSFFPGLLLVAAALAIAGLAGYARERTDPYRSSEMIR
ncbi:ABC transporter permease [Verrucosispora sp. WMMD1129]|uniref:ABC transporter permease n=1 Tax=Verrucosispora sp. WMMD1129 TaxID=3016093 RepID=UPI00249A13B6|nr:ABC transporter permease [Verrucosispora sp. WMMD1129]WFE47884.1 ABC transporter permease [Verrucosispora sp. WMMD1129]